MKSPLVDARFQVESGTWANGITVAYAASVYSDFLRSAVIFCTDYWFTRSFRLPRPASPDSTSKVETVHPQDLKCFHTYYLEKKKRISFPYLIVNFLRRRDCASKIEVSKRRCNKCKSERQESVNPRTWKQPSTPCRSKSERQHGILHDPPRAP